MRSKQWIRPFASTWLFSSSCINISSCSLILSLSFATALISLWALSISASSFWISPLVFWCSEAISASYAASLRERDSLISRLSACAACSWEASSWIRFCCSSLLPGKLIIRCTVLFLYNFTTLFQGMIEWSFSWLFKS